MANDNDKKVKVPKDDNPKKDKPKILLSKISKRGVSKAIGSSFGFGSWTIGETSIELEVDPPIDLTTDEGQERYKKLKATMTRMTTKALEEDTEFLAQKIPELNASIRQREKAVNNALESE